MATGSAPTQITSTQQQQTQHGNATISSMSLSNGTVSNGTGVTISNLGYYTVSNTNAVCSFHTNYMKSKSFKLR